MDILNNKRMIQNKTGDIIVIYDDKTTVSGGKQELNGISEPGNQYKKGTEMKDLCEVQRKRTCLKQER